MTELQGDAAELYRCDVCNRRTWISPAGLVAKHHDSTNRHYCPLSGKPVADAVVARARAVARHPASQPRPIPS